MAATILFCYSSFTFWQYLHFSTGGSHTANVRKELSLLNSFSVFSDDVKETLSFASSMLSEIIANRKYCSSLDLMYLFLASPSTTFSPHLTEGQSNFSWWALSVCIVFVPSEQWGSRPDFRSFLSAYFPIVPNLTMLFIFAKVYRLFWAGQHSPRNWKIHIYYIWYKTV